MHPRLVALLLVASCAPPAPPAEQAPEVHWVYPPPGVPSQLGTLRGHFGRSQAPQRPRTSGIAGEAKVPLRLPTPWPVPGAGPARAVVSGHEGARSAIELVDIDRGQVLWRDTQACAGLVVGVTAHAIVCSDQRGTRAVGLDGKARWHDAGKFIAMTGERVVLAGVGEAIILGAADGAELGRVRLPAAAAIGAAQPLTIDSIIASCGDAGRELFALGRDGKLARIADARGGPAVSWALEIGAVADLDPCVGDRVVVFNGQSLIAIDRATGKVIGRVEGVLGHWRAHDGSERIELATATGVTSWPADLTGPPVALPLPPLGRLIDQRGELRLVRASRSTAVVLDRAGVRAYLPFASMGGVLGDDAILAGSWAGSQGEAVHRIGLPARSRRVLRVPLDGPGIAPPAELRDLPAAVPLDPATGFGKPDTGKHAVGAIALDPHDSSTVYAVALEAVADDTTSAALASADLSKRAWKWQRADGCGPGLPVALAVASEVVACAARGVTSTVRATSLDGASRWQWEGDNVDRLQAAGAGVLVHDADRLVVLDAATGRVHGRFASDDGGPMPAALVELVAPATDVAARSETWLVTAEQGRLVARLPSAGMVAVWSLRVDGVIRALAASAEGVLVELEDGDAFRVDLRTAQITAMPGLGLTWRATAELVTGETAGGPIPAPPLAIPPGPRPGFDFRGRPIGARRPVALPPAARETEPPPLWTPIPSPPPLGRSWQYTLYDLTGGLRARNDYALDNPVVPAAARGPQGSPLVVAYGHALQDVLVLDPRTGDPVRHVRLPEGSPPAHVFGTIVDGSPVAGAVLAVPLRVVLF
ncbi:MAG: hypothetical protein H6Q90_3494 [Deltaproteobacteria bacterium]|nr:hypothetical protein [Deltaproteobacteria bacterium]